MSTWFQLTGLFSNANGNAQSNDFSTKKWAKSHTPPNTSPYRELTLLSLGVMIQKNLRDHAKAANAALRFFGEEEKKKTPQSNRVYFEDIVMKH